MEPFQFNWIANFIRGIGDDELSNLCDRGRHRDADLLPIAFTGRG